MENVLIDHFLTDNVPMVEIDAISSGIGRIDSVFKKLCEDLAR
jgi:hypothetical protein